MAVTRRVLLAFAAAAPFDHWAPRVRPPKRAKQPPYTNVYSNTY